MADDLGIQFFTAAKTQYEASGKWRLILVAALAYLHVALVVPFADQTRAKLAVDGEIASYSAADVALKPVLAATEDFAGRVDEGARRVAGELRDDLVRGFSDLSAAVEALMRLGPEAATGDAGAALFGLPTAQSPAQLGLHIPNIAVQQMPLPQQQAQMILPQQMQMQQPMPPADLLVLSPSVPIAPMPAELRAAVADGSALPGPGEVSPAFGDYIEAAIIVPAFGEANETWQTGDLPALSESAAELSALIAAAMAEAAGAADELGGLADAVKALQAEADTLAFAPPEDPRWWATVAGKEASIRTMIEGFAERAMAIGDRQAALDDLQAKVLAARQEREDAAGRIAAALAELDRQATELQSQIGELGGPLKAISFKLSFLAPLLPLIVGLTLAALALWTAESLRRMTLAVRIARDEGAGRVVRTWLRAAAGGSPLRVGMLDLALAALSVLWVVIAARGVAELPVSALRPEIVLAAAIAAVLAARIYHWYRAGEAIAEGPDSPG